MSAFAAEKETLKAMILTLRLTELQMLLAFANRDKFGKKQDLLHRALSLVDVRSPLIHAKIREIYKNSAAATATMNQGGAGYPPYGSNLTAAAMLNMANTHALQAAYGAAAAQSTLQGRNPYNTSTGFVPQNLYGAGGAAGAAAAAYGMQQQHVAAPPAARASSANTIPANPDVRLVKLPFYDLHGDLLKPTSLMPQNNSRFQEAQFNFHLSSAQATEVASHRDCSVGITPDYLYQIQLRFCQLTLEPGKEVNDEFPPSIAVLVNNKAVQLPNPIPTNKQGVEPKRPPRPVNITPQCKLSPIVVNNVSVKWAAGYGKGWVVGIWLVKKLSSTDLLERLKKKGTRNPEFTRGLIRDKLNDDDEVSTTSLKVSVACPLGKMRMTTPCRPSTCDHLQCFDASLFLQMNERKPTWNCPVCDRKALYDTLLIDGYFLEVLESSDLHKYENEIILEQDGSWKPVPKDDEKTKPPSSLPPAEGGNGAAKNGDGKSDGKSNGKDDEPEFIDLSDDDEPLPPPPAGQGGNPPLPPGPFPPMEAPPPPEMVPPPPPPPIECIDLD